MSYGLWQGRFSVALFKITELSEPFGEGTPEDRGEGNQGC